MRTVDVQRALVVLVGMLGCSGQGARPPGDGAPRPAVHRVPAPPPAAPATPSAREVGSQSPGDVPSNTAPEVGPGPFDSARAHREWSLKLHHALAAAIPGNVVHSPLSAEALLALLYRGARAETQQELANAAWPGATDAEVTSGSAARAGILATRHAEVVSASANAALVNDGIEVRPEFRSAIEKDLHAQVKTLSFASPAAAKTIEDWSNQATRGLAKSSLPRELLDPSSALIAINALYFRGLWAERFPEAKTKLQPYALPSGQQVQVKLMHRELDAPYAELPAQGGAPAARALELYYRGREFSLLVILPAPHAPLEPLEQQLDEARLQALTSALTLYQVRVALPRFRFASPAPVSFKPALQALGVRSAFEPTAADFSGVAAASSRSANLFLNDVYQSVFLQVDESGTTAAAVTVAKLSPISGQFLPSVEFRADQPFLFVLRHKPSSSVVMMGRINDPR